MSKSLAVLSCAVLLAACQPNGSDNGLASAPRAAADALDRATADARKARIADLAYEVFVDIRQGTGDFSGKSTLRFELSDASTDLTIDFGGGSVEGIEVNGEPVEAAYNGYFITVPADALRAGPNRIDIRYRHPYNKDGNGLHHFVDPVDGLTYLYTYLWPYYANRLFPSFDQPNLKARISLSVLAPEDWEVVSMASGATEPATGGARLWRFDTTPKMSTYSFSLHAGPYTIWKGDADGIPIRLMARQSLAEFVAVDEWMDVTRGGLAHYSRYFDIPYPFGKYDQLIVPNFNIGAMENIAAVTFSENYVQRQPSDRNQRERRASVILHEMAHMWFGNLVTHEWWNGLWLNESFATQMAVLAEINVTDFDDIWHGFFLESKRAAYQRDSRVTTHPIEMPIESTADFFSVFDAITYDKGSSVLKQLEHRVGAENYRRGVSAYLKEHAYGNTELSDFISHQEKSSGLDLAGWTDEWLYQAGFNSLHVEMECDGPALQSLAVSQTASPEHPVLRTHQLDLGLYHRDQEGNLVAGKVIPVTVSGARTVVDIPGNLHCPALVTPNHGDFAYAEIALSPDAADAVARFVAVVPDPLDRSMLLDALYRRAMAGDAPIAEYVERAMALAFEEKDPRVIEQSLGTVISAIDMLGRLSPESDDAFTRLVPWIEVESLRRAEFVELPDLKQTWFNTYLGVAASPAGLGTAKALLDGEAEVDGIEISADVRWKLLTVLSRNGAEGIDDLLAAERERDPSDAGTKRWLTARASMPDVTVKTAMLDDVQDRQSTSGLAEKRAVIAGLFPAVQAGLQFEMLDDVLAALPGLSEAGDPYFLSSYVGTLLRPMCRKESSAKMRAALENPAILQNTTTVRFLREALQADSECLPLR